MSQFQELNEGQWILIQELMSWSPPKQRGKPRTNLKRVIQDIRTEPLLIDGLCFGRRLEYLTEY